MEHTLGGARHLLQLFRRPVPGASHQQELRQGKGVLAGVPHPRVRRSRLHYDDRLPLHVQRHGPDQLASRQVVGGRRERGFSGHQFRLGGAGRLLQRVINAFNWDKGGKKPLFPDLVVDGAIGPRTLDGLALLLRARTSEAALVHALNCMQGAHYIEVAARNPSQRKFTDGWMKRTHCPD